MLAKPYESAWKGKVLSLGSDDRLLRITGEAQTDAAKFKRYKPYRVITASPDLLLLLVPASAALEISKAIYERYLKRFGKVYGRLPFSIGNIFFPQYLPMFSVLDAARRMERNFAMLHKRPRLLGELKFPPKDRLNWVTGEDYYHPYVLTAGRHTDADGYFYTMEGPMVSMHAEPKPQDALLYPNYYDCEWLGSSADRLRIHVGDSRRGPLTGTSCAISETSAR